MRPCLYVIEEIILRYNFSVKISNPQKKQFYASKKTESQVDMKEAKRMTLFIIMINVSRNGINAIMKNDPIKYLLKNKTNVWASEPTTKPDQAPASSLPVRQAPSPQSDITQWQYSYLTRTIQEKSNVIIMIHPLIASNNISAHLTSPIYT